VATVRQHVAALVLLLAGLAVILGLVALALAVVAAVR
jgi:hypothetical protein